MLCPVCRHDNFEGEDFCVHCGADLAGSDIPQSALDFEGRLLGEHLDALGVAAPILVEPGLPLADALARMRNAPTDCLLVTDGKRLVGVMTERDAVLKVAGKRVDGVTVATVMTTDPVVLRHDDTLAVAINKMAVGGFRHIPIVDRGAPSGVVAASDLFRHILQIVG